jgi:hypothetical protein
MKIVEQWGARGRSVEHVDEPVDAAMVALLGGDTVVISVFADGGMSEWHVTFTPLDVAVLGGALAHLASKGEPQ